MSRFLDFFEGRQIDWRDGRPVWWTLAPVRYQSDLLGATIFIPTEFITDGASVPRVPFLWLAVGGRGPRSATIHDFPYQFGYWLLESNDRLPVDRKTTDDVFHESLLVDPIGGATRKHAYEMWAGVRAGGWKAWNDRATRGLALNPEWTREWGVIAS